MLDKDNEQMTFSENPEEMVTQLAELCSKGIDYLKNCYFENGKSLYSFLIEIGITNEQIKKLGTLYLERMVV